MKHAYKAFYGALLVLGLAGVTPALAQGGYHWDSVCNCRRPDSAYQTRHVVRAPGRVVTRERVVNRTRVVRGHTRLVQENRLIMHVRPVVHRVVVVHRTNTVVRDVVLHRVNTTNKYREVNRTQVVNRYVPGSVRHVLERREVRGVNCNCGYNGEHRGFVSEGRGYESGGYEGTRYEGGRYQGGQVVSYRD